MLVLLSFALVLVATVLLVLGLLSDDGLLLIYLSIGSSVVAAVVLLVALRVNRPRQEASRAAPAPLPEPEPVREPALVGGGSGASATEADEEPATDATATGEWLAGDQDAWAADEAEDGDWDGEVEFPIADYDTLTTGQILPLLPQLYADEIDVVEERERATKGRAEILAKLEQLRAATSADPLASYTEPVGEGGPGDEWFPIEDYESLSAAQVRPLLRELDRDELAMVRERELALGRRQTLLDEIDILLGGSTSPAASPAPSAPAADEGPATAAEPAPTPTAAKKAAPATKAGAAKKAPAKKAAAKKAPAKKAGAVKAAAAKKAAPAKKAATKAAAAKKAPAEKAAAKATAAKKAPAKKAAPTKKAAPAKKAGGAKKAPAKKAPAKKATKRTGR